MRNKLDKIMPKVILPILIIMLVVILILNQLLTGNIKDYIASFLIEKSFLPQFSALSGEKESRFEEIKKITQNTAEILRKRLEEPSSLSASETDRLFRSFMSQKEDGSYRAFTDDRTRRLQMLAFRNNKGTVDPLEKRIITDAFTYFKPYAEALSPSLYNTYFTTDHLIWTYGAHDWPLVVEPDEDFRSQIWYSSALPENNPDRKHVWTELYYDSVNREWMISSLSPVYANDAFVGVVGHDFLLKGIIDLGRNLHNMKNTFFFFLDGSGNIIAHPETQSILDQHVENNRTLSVKSLSDKKLTEVLQTIRTQSEAGFQFTGDALNKRLVLYFPLESINWKLIYVANEAELFWVVSQINSTHFISFIFMSLLIVIFLVYIIRRIVLKPLYNLIVGISDIEKGNLDTQIPGSERKDEFGNVIRTFNDMAHSLHDYRNRIVYTNLELTELSQNLQALKDTTPDAVFIHDEEGTILDVNRTTLSMYGYTRNDILKVSIGDLSAPGFTQDMALRHMKKANAKGENHFEWQGKTKQGELFPLMIRLKRMVVNDKTYILAVATDISEQKKAEAELKSSEERFRNVIERSNDAIYVLYERKFDIVNQKFKEIFGLTLEDVNKPDFDFINLVAPKSIPIIEERMRRFKSGENLKPSYEFTAITKDGKEIEVEASVSYIKYKEGIATQGILRDITERKQLEQQLRQSQKMEAIGTLAGGVAHDFNNLLTVINGHAEMGLMRISEHEPAHRDMVSILHAGKRAEKLTSQLLAFSRKQIFEARIININDIIQGLQKMLRRLIGEDFDIRLELDREAPNIKADPGQIEQILMNLIINARDAINESTIGKSGKIITIRTDSLYLGNDEAHHFPNSKPGSQMILSITDNGIGMEDELKMKIFEPFFTTKKTGKGTGLGLSTVYGIVKQNGGEVFVDSIKNKGTTITIHWPATQESKSGEAPEQQRKEMLSGQESILLVEDDAGVRNFACNALHQLGYAVIEAENGKKALEYLKENKACVDLLVTDLIMPEMNGKELASQFAGMVPNAKILFTSGYTGEHFVTSGALDHDINFLSKPYSVHSLAKRIREILEDNPAVNYM